MSLINKDSFTKKWLLSVRGQEDQEAFKTLMDCYWDDAIELSTIVLHRLPSIGFLSMRERLNAFMVACEIIENEVYKKNYEDEEMCNYLIILSISIMRASNKAFNKALTMFETRVEQNRINRAYLAQHNGYRVATFWAKNVNPYF